MKRILIACILLSISLLWAETIPFIVANQLATAKIQLLYPSLRLSQSEQMLTTNDMLLAYIFHLEPTGYIIIGAQEELPPVYAYSGSSDYLTQDSDNPLANLAIADLSLRLQNQQEAHINQAAWQTAFQAFRVEQWPPVGYSNTEGWVKTLWTQSYPYNMYCPLDPLNSNRSLAGCPAIAMGQIVNYHRILNGTRLSDADDYHHQYGGRNYWIDNDFATLDFPSYPQLNGFLDEINYRYRYQQDLSDSLDAAIVFAVGSTLKQVYASNGSGTFAVSQALNAFHRFGFADAELLTEASPDLYSRMIANMQQALPVHLAVVTPSWNSGHNVVVDGYNTNGYFHVNFGFGGAYNGWILLPQQMPMNMTVVEGAVVDIKPVNYVLTVPDTLDFSSLATQSLEVYNMHNAAVTVEALIPGTCIDPQSWQITPSQVLPFAIPVNGMMSFTITYLGTQPSTMLEADFRLILDSAFVEVPVHIDAAVFIEEDTLTPILSCITVYPNPFSQSCSIDIKSPYNKSLKLEVFNIKGQKLFSDEAVPHNSKVGFTWNGKDAKGNSQPSGVYLYRVTGTPQCSYGKLLKLK